MTKFADQLFDDLMREHGSTLTHARRARAEAARRHAPGAAGGRRGRPRRRGRRGRPCWRPAAENPAYSVTKNPNGTITLAVYRKSGIAGANAKLHELGDSQVYVVPAGPGCPSMSSLPAPAVPLNGQHLSVQSSVLSRGGAVTVNAHGIPAGDILVVAVETTTSGGTTTSLAGNRLTSLPAPSCVSLPAPPAPPTHP